MKKRTGFTLVEMVVAIAIAIIMGGAFTIVVVDRLAQIERDTEQLEVRINNYEDSKGQVEGWLGTPVAGGTTASQTTASPTQATTLPTTEATTTAAPPPTTTTAAPTETTQAYILPQPNPNFNVTTNVTSTWQQNGKTFVQYSFDIANITPGANVWNSLVMIVPEGTQVEGFWSGTYELEGVLLTLYPYGWAERVSNRATIDIAIQLSADGTIEITEFVVT